MFQVLSLQQKNFVKDLNFDKVHFLTSLVAQNLSILEPYLEISAKTFFPASLVGSSSTDFL